MNWYVLQTKPHKEFSVYELLMRKGIETYFPFINVQPKNPRAAKRRPFFPSYMFVNLDLDSLGANALKWMQGTKGLVSFGGTPAIVPDTLIDHLHQRLESIETAGGLQNRAFQTGETVKIVEGPFAGYETIFDAYIPGKERVQVLLTFLSAHPQPLKLHIDHIDKMRKP